MKTLIVCDAIDTVSDERSIALAKLIDKFRSNDNDVKVVCADKYRADLASYCNLATMHLTASMEGVFRANGVVSAKPDDDLLEDAVIWADVVYVENTCPLCEKAGRLAIENGRRIILSDNGDRIFSGRFFRFAKAAV